MLSEKGKQQKQEIEHFQSEQIEIANTTFRLVKRLLQLLENEIDRSQSWNELDPSVIAQLKLLSDITEQSSEVWITSLGVNEVMEALKDYLEREENVTDGFQNTPFGEGN